MNTILRSIFAVALMVTSSAWASLAPWATCQSLAAAMPGAIQEVTLNIMASSDDAEEGDSNPGQMDLSSSDLELGYDHAGEPQIIGLRFADAPIPAGATILEAYVQFGTDETSKNVNPFSQEIFGELSADPVTYSSTAFDITNRTRSNASVVWSNVPDWTTQHQQGPAERTPDIAAVIQELIDQPGYASGNALALILETPAGDPVGRRSAESYDGTTSVAPSLYVKYDAPAPTTQVTLTIGQGADDAEEGDDQPGKMDVFSSDLELGYDHAGEPQTIGLRFTGDSIPAGAKIVSAYVKFGTDETSKNETPTDGFDQEIWGELNPNPASFSSTSFDITSRTKTSASVIWEDVPEWTVTHQEGADERTPDISTVVQEIVDQPGYAEGNPIVIILDTPAGREVGRRSAEAFDGTSAVAPKLVVEFEGQGVPPNSSELYRAMWVTDPETEMTLGWNQIAGDPATVYYGTTDFGQDYTQYPQAQPATRTTWGYLQMNNTFARLTGLTPDTVYYFVIANDAGVSPRMWFRTAPDTPKKMTFIAGGDTKSSGTALAAGRLTNQIVPKLRPDFIIFSGDFTSGNGTNAADWYRWFNDWSTQTIAADGQIFPFVPVHGNHEDGDKTQLNKLFDAPFNPTGQANEEQNIYYSITFGGDFFYYAALNSQIDEGGDQRAWLAQDLEDHKDFEWLTASFHKPFRPHTASKAENNYQLDQWGPLFNQYKMDLVMDGDSHMTRITFPLVFSDGPGSDERFIRDDANGTMYIGEGSWGASPRLANDAKSWTLHTDSYNQVKWVWLIPAENGEPTKMQIHTVKTVSFPNGTLTDHVTAVGELDPFGDRCTYPANIELAQIPFYGEYVTLTRPFEAVAGSAPTAPMNLVATAQSTTEVDLTWDPLADPTIVRAVTLERKKGVSGDWEVVSDNIAPTDTSFTDRQLLDGTEYFYRAFASNIFGNSPFSAEAFVMTPEDSRLSVVFQRGRDGYDSTTDMWIAENCPDDTFIAVEFDVDSNDRPCGDNSLGDVNLGLIRFDNLFGNGAGQLPSGAEIIGAELRLYSTNESSSSDGNLSLHRMLRDWDTSTSWAAFGAGVDRDDTDAKAVPDDVNLADQENVYLIYDVTSSVKAWQADPASNYGWVLYNPSTNGWRGYTSQYTGANEDQFRPQLTIYFAEDDPNIVELTETYQVSDGADDAEESRAANTEGIVELDSSDLELVLEQPGSGDENPQWVGVRFQGVNVPQGATVKEAYIQFAQDETKAKDPCELIIHAEASDSAPAFEALDYNISARPMTNAEVAWNIVAPWDTTHEQGEAQRSPNLNALVQEVVDRAGWQEGNSLVFIIEGDGTRTAESFDGTSSLAPQLVVTWAIDKRTEVSFAEGVDAYSGAQDTWISSVCADDTHPTADELDIDGDDDPCGSGNRGQNTGLIKFASIFGPGGLPLQQIEIASAELIFTTTNPGSGSNPIELYRMLTDWTDTDTWNSLGSGVQTDGSDAASTPTSVAIGNVVGDQVVFDVTEDLKAWASNPAMNYGWFVNNTSTNGWSAASSEASALATRPKLVVSYLETGETADTFPQSVASGDPTADSVILWTRVFDGANLANDLPVSVEVATDMAFTNVVYSHGNLLARAAHDHTVKHKVTGLQPFTTYYYRFQYLQTLSRVGRTKTAPAAGDMEAMAFAVLNCQDYNGRYYNTLLDLVQRDEVDYVLQLGDYIYETTTEGAAAPGERKTVFSDEASALPIGNTQNIGSRPLAANSLSNYRDLYKTYRSDPALQRAHELFPFITIWDDHEFSDDSWQANGTYFSGLKDELNEDRKRRAEQVWFEYQPVGIGLDAQGVSVDPSILYPNTQIYRSLNFGANAEVILTDYRTFRPDHLIPEDALPATIVVDEATAEALLGSATWQAIRGGFDPYITLEDPQWDQPLPEFGGASLEQLLKSEALGLYTDFYLSAGNDQQTAEQLAAAKVAEVIQGNLSTTFLNLIAIEATGVPLFDQATLAALPRGLSYLFMGKQDFFSNLGSRNMVVRESFDLYAAARAVADQLADPSDPAPDSQDAYGDAQVNWLQGALFGTPAKWKILANSVSYCPITLDLNLVTDVPLPPELQQEFKLTVDHWDGFPQVRQGMIDLFDQAGNVVLVSGDIHGAFASKHFATSGGVVPEFTAPSTSSENFAEAVEEVAIDLLGDTPEVQALLSLLDGLIDASTDGTGVSEIVELDTGSMGYVVINVPADGSQITGNYRYIAPQEVVVNHYAEGVDAADPVDPLFTTVTLKVAEDAATGTLGLEEVDAPLGPGGSRWYRAVWTDDPTTSMTLAWDQNQGGNATVYYGMQDYGKVPGLYPMQQAPTRTIQYRGMNNHFARLTGLQPDSDYYFIIVDDIGSSEVMWFRTAPDTRKPITFVAGGDSRTNAEPRRRANILVSKIRPLFILHSGDFMDSGTDAEWAQWLSEWQLTISDDGRIYPIVPTHGNHENDDRAMLQNIFDINNVDAYYNTLIGDYFSIFTLNTELEPGVGYGQFSGQTDQKWNEQTAWLVGALQDPTLDAKWRFANFHRPMRPHTSGKDEGLGRIAAWADAFYANGIDVAFESDTHMVKHTFPVRPSNEPGSYQDFIRDDANGYIFTGEGSWGAPKRPIDDNKPWTLAADSFWQFKLIHATDQELQIRTVLFEDSSPIDGVVALTQADQDADPFAIPQNLDLWQPLMGEVMTVPFSGADIDNLPLVGNGTEWSYNDTGADLGTAWKEVGFDDSTWATGFGEFGYGDNDEVTLLDFGGNPSDKIRTYYFRKEFELPASANVILLNLKLQRDDGAVVYINGKEVARSNMPDGDVDYQTFAVTAAGGVAEIEYVDFFLLPEVLVPGTNTIAVSLHQSDASSSDISFNLDLTAVVSNVTDVTPPAAPANLAAFTLGTEEIALTWTPSAGNKGQQVERRLASGDASDWEIIARDLLAGTSEYNDDLLAEGTEYLYRVRNYNAGGLSPFSAEVSATTDADTGPKAILQADLDGYTGAQDVGFSSVCPDDTFLREFWSIDQQDDPCGGGFSGVSEYLIRFDDIFGGFPYQVPNGVEVTSATLRFYTANPGSGSNPLQAYRMLQDWDAVTTTWNTFGPDGVSTDDVEAAATLDDEQFGNVTGDYVEFDVTDTVKAWQSGENNYGWFIQNTSTNGWDIPTSLYSGELFEIRRPRLTIRYASASVEIPGGVNFDDGTLAPWTAISVSSDRDWRARTVGDRMLAEGNGFGATGDTPSNDWLISPPIDLSNFDSASFSFENAVGFGGPDIKVLISTDYNGSYSGDPEQDGTWVELTGWNKSPGNDTFVPSGDLDLTGYDTVVHLAFQYTSTGGDPGEGARWRIDTVALKGVPKRAVLAEKDFEDGSLAPWTPISVTTDDRVWQLRSFGGNSYAQMNGFGSSDPNGTASDDWLISPPLNTTTTQNETLEFLTAKNFVGPDILVKISTDYVLGQNPNNYTWTELTPAALSPGNYEFTASGTIDISAFDGDEVYVAFHYISTGPGPNDGALWQVDDISITATGQVTAPLFASLAVDNTSGTTTRPLTFTSSATGGTPPYTYALDFGDGGSASGESVSYTYSAPGPFTATLTVTDDSGATATSTVNLSIIEGTIYNQPAAVGDLRVATFNAYLNRASAGALLADLSDGEDEQAQKVAEIIQRVRPEVLLLNEFDYEPNNAAIDLFRQNYLEVTQGGQAPIIYPYVYVAPSNTGIPTPYDLDNDGSASGDAGDSYGFGDFPGHYGMAFLSQYPISETNVRTFQTFLWKDMPGAKLPELNGQPWYSPEELDSFRLSSKSHWDVPVEVNGVLVHLLMSHPTPPVFDGAEDRNGLRNHDEIRFWADYVTPGAGDYIYDDKGNFGGLPADTRFVIMGDQNADPVDGDSTDDAILLLLNNNNVDASFTPISDGGLELNNAPGHTTNEDDTADFGLRADYVLPSLFGLNIENGAVFWPTTSDDLYPLVGPDVQSSDHRLVWLDLTIDELGPENPFQSPTMVYDYWKNIAWFGWVDDRDWPLVYHLEHGLLEFVDGGSGPYRVFNHRDNLGYLYIDPLTYPNDIYSYTYGAFLYYFEGTGLNGNARIFYNWQTNDYLFLGLE